MNKISGIRGLFVHLLLGNLASKLLLVGSDVLAVLALSQSDFGAFALLQGLIISGAVISVWGADQAIVSVIGRTGSSRYAISRYLDLMGKRVAGWSIIVAASFAMLAMGSRITFPPTVLAIVAIIIIIEARLILNAAVLRAYSRPYHAVLLFDGLRHLALFAGALWVYAVGGDFKVLLYFWLATAAFCFLAGSTAVRGLLASSGTEEIPEADRSHASGIARFGGLWSVTQFVISRIVLIFSAYLLTPDDLGTVAFFLKLMVVFTFLQTVMVQAVAPVIGRVSSAENLGQAKRIYATTTFFLAVTVVPLVGACLLAIRYIEDAFSISYIGPASVIIALFLAQALNIGTGIIGQFIIHFGRAKELLIVSVVGAVVQGALLLALGILYGVPGVLAAYAAANLLLVVLKNVLAAREIGFHGFAPANLLIVGAITAEVLLLSLVVDTSGIALAWLLLAHALFCIPVMLAAIARSPDVSEWVKARLRT